MTLHVCPWSALSNTTLPPTIAFPSSVKAIGVSQLNRYLSAPAESSPFDSASGETSYDCCVRAFQRYTWPASELVEVDQIRSGSFGSNTAHMPSPGAT